MNEAINRGKKRVETLEKRQTDVDKLIASAPLFATQLSELNRDADMVRVKVTQLVSKKAEAEITADLEGEERPSSYRVLGERASAGDAGQPNRSQALLLALLGALALGAGGLHRSGAVGQVAAGARWRRATRWRCRCWRACPS